MPTVSMPARKREQVILDHLPLVKSIATGVHRRCPSEVLHEDLVSAGVVGLLQAYQRFDKRRKLKLRTLAAHRIRGAMLDYLRDLDPLPRDLRRFHKKRENVIARLSSVCCAQPSEEDIAQEMALPLGRYRILVQAAQDCGVSLDATGHDGGPPLELMTPDHQVTERRALCRQLQDAIERLPTSDRRVMTALKAGESAREIADRLRVTEGRISQIKNRAIRRLRIELAVSFRTS
jgi:RNA polymerase sigma factor FliA